MKKLLSVFGAMLTLGLAGTAFADRDHRRFGDQRVEEDCDHGDHARFRRTRHHARWGRWNRGQHGQQQGYYWNGYGWVPFRR